MSVLTAVQRGRQLIHEPVDPVEQEQATWTIGISFPASDVPRRPFPRNRGELDHRALFAGAASGGSAAFEEE
jgi:hypothetical protein